MVTGKDDLLLRNDDRPDGQHLRSQTLRAAKAHKARNRMALNILVLVIVDNVVRFMNEIHDSGRCESDSPRTSED
jgi:hypothetical protein